MRKLLLYLLLILILPFSAAAQVSLVLGNPSDAASGDADNFLVAHTGYILSYNRSRGAANWVAWHLSASDIGSFDQDAFAPDTALPQASQIRPGVYLRSGFDKGHVCPAKDRSTTEAINRETYLMSNMQPQDPRLNRVTWKSLEDYTRREVRRGNEAYIYAGCYGTKGRLQNKVTIPTNCWKVVVLLPEGNNDLRRINRNTRVIAVDMPNGSDIRNSWREYIFSVDTIEERTGFDLLSTLSDEIESALEAKTAARN